MSTYTGKVMRESSPQRSGDWCWSIDVDGGDESLASGEAYSPEEAVDALEASAYSLGLAVVSGDRADGFVLVRRETAR